MTTRDAIVSVGQRSELTYKYNVMEQRHGWLRLTPAYSVKVVDDLLAAKPESMSVLDPFSGTGTTALCASNRGHKAVAVDINPFLVWFAEVKLDSYGPDLLEEVKAKAIAVDKAVEDGSVSPAPPPGLFNIDRWWNPDALDYLCRIKKAVSNLEGMNRQFVNLLKVAFCRTLIRLSNAAFNHQSMSFKKGKEHESQGVLFVGPKRHEPVFSREVFFVVRSAQLNPRSTATVVQGDSKFVAEVLGKETFDLLITSPPYPNRISYIRELRPYMYWLGFLNEAQEAAALDWKATGGTWGSATSRLSEWQPDDSVPLPEFLRDCVDRISSARNKSGLLLAKYVRKYFEDMWRHIESAYNVIKPEGEVHYIVGNSKFYDVLVPVERIYQDMLAQAGYRNVGVKLLRKRNSKKELYEFDVFGSKRMKT